jgi:hypothetical protein
MAIVVRSVDDDPDGRGRFAADRPQPVRIMRLEGDGVARRQLVAVEADLQAEPAFEQVGIFFAAVPEERVLPAGLGPGLVSHVEKLDLIVGLGGEALPFHAAGKADVVAVMAALDDRMAASRLRAVCFAGGAFAGVSFTGRGRPLFSCGACVFSLCKQPVHGHAEFGRHRPQRPDRRRHQATLDLGNKARRNVNAPGHFTDGEALPFTLGAKFSADHGAVQVSPCRLGRLAGRTLWCAQGSERSGRSGRGRGSGRSRRRSRRSRLNGLRVAGLGARSLGSAGLPAASLQAIAAARLLTPHVH